MRARIPLQSLHPFKGFTDDCKHDQKSKWAGQNNISRRGPERKLTSNAWRFSNPRKGIPDRYQAKVITLPINILMCSLCRLSDRSLKVGLGSGWSQSIWSCLPLRSNL